MDEKIKEKIPSLKKDMNEFIQDESGIVSKDKVIKAGVVMGGIAVAASTAGAGGCSYSHTNDCTHDNQVNTWVSGNCVHGDHSNDVNHTNNYHCSY